MFKFVFHILVHYAMCVYVFWWFSIIFLPERNRSLVTSIFENKPKLFYSDRYAAEVDVDFVRKSVRAIGRCAIKVEQAAEKCVSTLLDLIQTKVNYVVQEAIVVIKVS